MKLTSLIAENIILDKFYCLDWTRERYKSTYRQHIVCILDPLLPSIFNSLPDNKMFDLSKLKQIADKILRCT